MSERLFNENERFNEKGHELNNLIDDKIRDVMHTYFSHGYSIRDIEYIANAAVKDIAHDIILDHIPEN